MASTGPLDDSTWVTRLSGLEGVSVIVASGLDAAKRSGAGLPLLAVVPSSEAITSDLEDSIRRRRIRHQVSVLYGVKAFGQETHADALAALNSRRAAVWALLIGWQPPGADLPAEWVAGQILDTDGQTIWWADQFETDYWRVEP